MSWEILIAWFRKNIQANIGSAIEKIGFAINAEDDSAGNVTIFSERDDKK